MEKICRLCNEIVNDKPLALWHHLSSDHPDVYERAAKSEDPEAILNEVYKNYETNKKGE